MKILFATRSAGKQREATRLLSPHGFEVVFPDGAGVLPSPEEDRLELADSFEANARAKAAYFARRTGIPTIADDSGLEVFALGGAPGVRSKRFAGASGTAQEIDAANNAELQRRLLGAEERRRGARFRCVLVYLATPTAVPVVAEGTCQGRILTEARGSGGFGYDPYFLADDLGCTLSEAPPEEKDRVSHRGRALQALLPSLPRVG